MFFNPLFIDTNSVGTAQNQKNTKLGKSQYLFSDIIKISLAKNESAESEAAPSFNLSLVNTNGNINPLFLNGGNKTDKPAAEGDGSTQNAEAMLIEFLQFAFVNQDVQLPNAAKLQELMKNKELLLSKESLTNAISQLLQIYQTTNGKDVNGKQEPLSPEKLAQQIFASLDESGKVILNFKNLSSQIKIELTKLNSSEKEQFISTKIIPFVSSDTQVKTEDKDTAKIPAASAESKESTTIPSVEPASGGNIVDGAKVATTEAAAVSADTGKSETTAENTLNTNKNIIVPISSDLTKEKSADKSTEVKVNNVENEVLKNQAVENTNSNIAETAKKIITETSPVTQKNNGQVELPADKENSDYKLRVVEINAEKGAKEQDAKIYSLTPFEKNILKKSNITFTSTEASGKKQAEPVDIKNPIKPAVETDVKTITQADNEILKTNNLLFKETVEAGTTAKTNNPVTTDSKPETKVDSKGNILNSTKTVNEKADEKDLAGQAADVKKTVTAESGQGKDEITKTGLKEIKDEKDTKKLEINDGTDKQVKQESAKTTKPLVVVDENKGKTIEQKKEVSETVKDTDKKQTVETEKSSNSNLNAEQKGSENTSNSSTPDKKENDFKQFVAQNISDKEKVVFPKDELLKETARQADVTKTIKTYEIIKELRGFIEQGNRNSMILKIVPENLGNVKITLDMSQNMVQARIDVDNENVKQFVQTNIESLKQSLTQSGINVGALSVNVSSSDQKNQKFVSPYKKKLGNFVPEDIIEEGELVTNKRNFGYNSYDYLA